MLSFPLFLLGFWLGKIVFFWLWLFLLDMHFSDFYLTKPQSADTFLCFKSCSLEFMWILLLFEIMKKMSILLVFIKLVMSWKQVKCCYFKNKTVLRCQLITFVHVWFTNICTCILLSLAFLNVSFLCMFWFIYQELG